MDRPSYKDFKKYDARRYLVALIAVDRLKERATIHYLSQEIGCTRAEVQRALATATEQFGVLFDRDGSVYRIRSWGVLKRTELARFLQSE